MAFLEKLDVPTHQEVVRCRDEESGLRAIIAIHDTTFGPALGGTRMWPYQTEEQALEDVLRLSRAMTFKAIAADLDFGGGKAVIIGDPEKDKSEARLHAFGRFIESLGGRFLTGEDVGITADDVRIMGQATSCAVHPSKELDPGWDTAYLTAFGVVHGIKAAVEEKYQTTSLFGIKVAVQGLGKVGGWLARLLHAEGAKLTLTDLNQQHLSNLAEQLDAQVVSPSDIYQIETDVFSPCALGGILNDEVIPHLKCQIVAGAANNQLAAARHGEELWQRGILYAPDYLINAGGLISALYEMGMGDKETVLRRTAEIYDRLKKVIATAKQENISPDVAMDRLVEERLQRAKGRISRANDL